jgi:predicted  nucleic acid-binding Zn-ribbon protein
MSEDPTQRIPDERSFEERVLSELAAIRTDIAKLDARLTTVEDKVDARLRETRPIWENVQARLTTIETTLDDIRLQMLELNRDSLAVRARVARLEERERPPAA